MVNMPRLFSGSPEDTAAVGEAVKALESNKRAVTRWFFRFLVAFNLLLWSVALAVAFVIKASASAG